MDSKIIEIDNVHKVYSGFSQKVHALKGVSLSVEEGSVFGLLGPNGAGKTTLLKLILGLMRPTSGNLDVFGGDTGKPGNRKHFGYLPENHKFPNYMKGADILRIYAGLSGMPASEANERIPAMMQKVGLDEKVLKMKVKKYSKGMQQRLGLAQALIHRPKVVFLDEPTDGIDPVGKVQMRRIMKQARDEGTTLFINSHLLAEVEAVCDRVAILNHGRLSWQGAVRDINVLGNLFRFTVSALPEAALQKLRTEYKRFSASEDYFDVEVPGEEHVTSVIDLLREHEVRIYGIVKRHKTLEDFFMEAVNNAERQGEAS
ncbi:MAG: ABC transporter ATP-binding protein [Planctomycetota bacterium]|nr:ABC transporter ATP-binding protein [Planctomycetota bacterium]